MKQEKYLFFRSEVDEDNVGGVGATSGGGSCLLVPASRMTGMSPTSDTNVRVSFESVYNMDVGGAYENVIQDYVDLTVTTHRHKAVMDAILEAVNGGPHNDGFIVVADDVTTNTANETVVGKYINKNISACTVNLAAANDGDVDGVSAGTALWNSYGVGMTSTEIAPTYEQTKMGRDIISTVLVDLTGLKAEDDLDDVIGVSGSDPAYFAKYLTATMGILYKIEVTCLEVPTVSSGTLLLDVDISSTASATASQSDDGNGYDSIADAAGNYAAVGTTKQFLVPGQPTNAHYFYLTCGVSQGTSAANFNAGKFMIKFFGHASF